eukprot:NODE_193_length_13314_cov_0.305638.p9 type:complete len:182 gc:universal NODE_193_length_13314_cov_0.305638:2338-1793(-)
MSTGATILILRKINNKAKIKDISQSPRKKSRIRAPIQCLKLDWDRGQITTRGVQTISNVWHQAMNLILKEMHHKIDITRDIENNHQKWVINFSHVSMLILRTIEAYPVAAGLVSVDSSKYVASALVVFLIIAILGIFYKCRASHSHVENDYASKSIKIINTQVSHKEDTLRVRSPIKSPRQ